MARQQRPPLALKGIPSRVVRKVTTEANETSVRKTLAVIVKGMGHQYDQGRYFRARVRPSRKIIALGVRNLYPQVPRSEVAPRMDPFPAPTDLPAPYRRREECPHLARTAKIVALALVYFGGAGIRVRKLFPGGSQAASVRVVAGEATRSRSRPGG